MAALALLLSIPTFVSTVQATVFVPGAWTIVQQGHTGVSAMQIAVVSETKAIIFDKVERNPLLRPNGKLAWGVEYDLTNNNVRTLNPKTNTFCAAGSHLGNGTFVNTGGNPVVLAGESGTGNGHQGIRLFDACTDGTCDVFEDPANIHLTSNRWYPSTARLDDGSIFITGGSISGGYINSASIDNPTYEFFPPKNINGFNGVQIHSPFLVDTLNGNEFPHVFGLPNKKLFLAANRDSMIFDWRTNVETRLPRFPNGVRVTYPFSASGVLLPLSPLDGYAPKVFFCGGATVSDTAPATSYSSQTPASAQCSRMTLSTAGIAAGWELETLPQSRIMGESILLPDGRVLIINGAKTGVAGYGNVANQIGASNADNPTFQPVLYDPEAAPGFRFSQAGLPNSTIPRMYHSVATLVPDGRIMIAGSNPNDDVTTRHYQTEYRVEWLSPSYMTKTRPTFTGLPAIFGFGTTAILTVTLPPNTVDLKVAIIDLGFATHGVHLDQRMVYLTHIRVGNILTITAPPDGGVYPPGPAYVFVIADGVPSIGKKVLIGDGGDPPSDEGARDNMRSILNDLLRTAGVEDLVVPQGEEGSV